MTTTATPHWQQIDWSAHVADARLDGRRVRYVDYGSGPPLLLVHGLGGSWTTWLENIPVLATRHRVIGVDLPGFGHSEALPAPAAMATHADVLGELLEHLEAGPVTVVGHSMGGLVATALAEAHPARVGAVVLVNAGGVPLTPFRLAAIVRAFAGANAVLGRPAVLRAIARRPKLRRMALAGFMTDPGAISPALAAETIPLMAAPGFLDAVVAAAGVVSLNRVPELACPVLLLWGAEDRILPLTSARTLAAALPGSRLQILAGAGHCPMFETPDRFNDALLAFTADVGTP